MAITTASGIPSYSGTMIPQLWASKLLVKFYANTVLSEIANNDYTGEIKQMGDKVTIATLPDITISDYAKGGTLVEQNPEPSTVEMYVDKAKYFCFPSNPIDIKQSIVSFVDRWADDASKQMKIAIERSVYAAIYTDADTYNKGTTAGKISGNINLGTAGTAVSVDKTNAIDVLLRATQALDEQNVPEDDRWVILPAWYTTVLLESDLKAAFLTGDSQSVLRTGKLGMINNLTIYKSNLLPVVSGDTHVLCGHKSALTFVTQLTENEVIPNPKTFGKLHRGLQVYGFKTTKAPALVDLVVKPA